ncbi:type I-E CRISPR-associated protein Cse1/CasA [Nocardia vulneris]|uniref:type I-E CRISPR-associated protein Cse1/CasA n=1 Tax=Nocardia vulneris TaxID=1141657 RepID=UPI0030CA78DF
MTIDFDLLEDPWIPVLDLGGRSRVLSLRAVFCEAHELSVLAGELPTQSFAILRLLLAIVRRSFRHRPGTAAEAWQSIWQPAEGREPITLPVREIDDYLSEHAGRFRLFDPQRPFFQVAGLESVNGAVNSLDRLIADVPNGEKYFTTRGGVSLERIEFAEAARWLVHAQAFDPSGIKTGAVGDLRVKAGKGYPIGLAWTGNLGGLFWEGASLRETLVLNLVLHDINEERFAVDDLPPWEREPDRADVDERRPAGPADLCTWQSRRIRLVRDDTHVTGVQLCNGDALEPFNRHTMEPMTAWRFSEAQTKKAGGQARHYPREHDPQRALWRGFTSLFSQADDAIAPGLLEWLSYLIDEGALPHTHPVRLHAVGMRYINNQSVVGEVFDDTIGFRAALVSSNPRLRVIAINAVHAAEGAVDAVAGLAWNLALASGGESVGARDRARDHGYFTLDVPYRRWLGSLHPDGDVGSYLERWEQLVRSVIEPIGDELVASSGMHAWVGREVRGSYLDANIAASRFHGRLKKLLPGAYRHRGENGGTAA